MRSEFEVEAAVKADGEVLGLRILDTDDVGGSVSTLTIHFTNKLNNLFNTYHVKHLRLEGRSVLTNKCPVVPNRGIGKPGMCFIWERIMDGVARELTLDPVTVRRRNLIAVDQFPYTTPNGNIHGSGLSDAPRQGARKRRFDKVRRARRENATTAADRNRRRHRAWSPAGRNAARDWLCSGVDARARSGWGKAPRSRSRKRRGRRHPGLPELRTSNGTTAARIVGDIPEWPLNASRWPAFDPFVTVVASRPRTAANNFHL